MEQTKETIKLPAVCASTKQGKEAYAEPAVWTEAMLKALENGVKGGKWFTLIDKVYREKTLGIAFAKVYKNQGASGLDRVRVEDFKRNCETELRKLSAELTAGKYQPQAIRRVFIPKPGSSEQRPLGIPTVRDRVVQEALRIVIEPIFEKCFLDCSYGFRPNRGAKDALRNVDQLLADGYNWVVDADIRKFFDTIDHEILVKLIEEKIADQRIIKLIWQFLKQPISEDGKLIKNELGTPQGGVISPLLANIYLHQLDLKLVGVDFKIVRYADDLVVLTKTPEEAETARQLVETITTELKLELHQEKTKIVNMEIPESSFEFLGYRFYRSKKGKICKLVREKSQIKLREKIRQLTKRHNGNSMQCNIDRINPILKGWFEYFKQAHFNSLANIDKWIRGRLRSILRSRIKRKGRANGLDHQRWPNSYFDQLKLFNLVESKKALIRKQNLQTLACSS